MAPCFGGEKEAVEGISMGLAKHILGKMKSLWKGVGAWAEKFITEEMQGECGVQRALEWSGFHFIRKQ